MWFFTPKNNLCIECIREIDIYLERNYIVWDEREGVYRRECATCYDAEHSRAYERHTSSDSMMRRLSNEGQEDK